MMYEYLRETPYLLQMPIRKQKPSEASVEDGSLKLHVLTADNVPPPAEIDHDAISRRWRCFYDELVPGAEGGSL